MKVRCLLGHQWHTMPWLMERPQPGKWYRMPGPKKACLRCGELRYRYIAYIPSPEGGGGRYGDYEGQYLRDYPDYETYIADLRRNQETFSKMWRKKYAR